MSKNTHELDKSHVKQDIADVIVNDIGVRARGARRRVATHFTEPSMTKQADRDGANIHKLLERFQRSGHLPQVVAKPITGEYPAVDSFHEAMNIIAQSTQAFDQLPVALREKFHYDPAQLLAFVSDENNRDEMIKLGLIEAPDDLKGQGATPPAPSTQRAQNAGEVEGAAPEGGK